MAYDLVQENNLLFHIVHIKNLPSILKNGLLSLNEVKKRGIAPAVISYENIQQRRDYTSVKLGKCGTLHDYVSLYFGARSPMLCALRYRFDQSDIIYIAVSWSVLTFPDTIFTDGNAASSSTQHYVGVNNLSNVDLNAARKWYWNDDEETRRKKSAEVLVFEKIPKELLEGFFVRNDESYARVSDILRCQGIEKEVLKAPEYYY